MKKKTLLTLILTLISSLFIHQQSLAQIVNTSTGNGNWNTPATWSTTGSSGTVTYIIEAGDTVSLTNDLSGIDTIKIYGRLSISTGAFADIDITLTNTGLLYIGPSGSMVGGYRAIFFGSLTTVITFNGSGGIQAPSGGWNLSGEQYATSSTSGFTTGDPLPVEWLQTGVVEKDGAAFIFWSTATEYNNSHFEIEKANQENVFEKIGTVQGAGYSHEINEYNFTDHTYGNHDVYYRIKQVDFDGKYTYSNVISLSGKQNVSGNTPKILLYPNYFSNADLKKEVVIEGLPQGNHEFVLINSKGQVLKQKSFYSENNERNKIEVDKAHLPGNYFLILQAESKNTTTFKIQIHP